MANKQEVANANYTVYEHIAPNGKRYFGLTSQKPEERWKNGKGYKGSYFGKAINKHGWENIEHKIIKANLTAVEASELEKKLISEYETTNRDKGYNVSTGGEYSATGVIRSEETRRKISESHKGLHYNIGVSFTEERKQHLRENHADVSGTNNPMYGKKWTPEQIATRQSHRVYEYGGKNPCAKKIVQRLDDGTVIKVWGSISEASKEYCRTSIKDVLKGKYKHHKGYVWEYYKGE